MAGLALDRIQLERRFRGVRVNRRPAPLGEVAHRSEQRPRAARRKARGEAVAQPPTRGAMPARAQVLALGDRLTIRLTQCRWIRRARSVKLAISRTRANRNLL